MFVKLNENGHVVMIVGQQGSTSNAINGERCCARMGTTGVLTCYGDNGAEIFNKGMSDQLWQDIQNAEVEAHECRANRCESEGNLAGFKAYSQIAIYVASLTLAEYKASVIIR